MMSQKTETVCLLACCCDGDSNPGTFLTFSLTKLELWCHPCVRLPVWSLMSEPSREHEETPMAELLWPK